MNIKKPDWSNIIITHHRAVELLNKWFEENVEPVNKMLSEAVEVYRDMPLSETCWYSHKVDKDTPTHKALLINIQPIKEDTAEDVLREFVKRLKGSPFKDEIDLVQRAKAVLEKK